MIKELEPTVFIVDADGPTLKDLEVLLQSVCLRTETYLSAEDFFRNYDHSCPACLILGDRLPGVGGIGAFQRLRQKGDRVPVIFLTGHGTVAAAVRAMREGAFDFLEKPLDHQYLIDRVQAAIALAQENRTLVLGIARDITERKLTEKLVREHDEHLFHVSRLSTLGEMASSLAHELNQPLSAILSYASASRRLILPQDTNAARLKENLDQVILQAKRAGEIIKRVRTFAQARPAHVRPTDANAIVREVLAFLRSDVVHQEVEVNLELCQDLPQVLADPIQLEQVLLNLMRNALEAMAPMRPQERRLTIHTSVPVPGTVKVAVSDTGVGLHPEMSSRIFAPFFTTKADGLGMGLSIARSIVEKHRGKLWIEPGRGRGCTFVFTLPAASDDPTAPQ